MMKIDKRTIIFIGIVTISVVIAVLAITIYYGMRAGGSFPEVISIIFRETQIVFFVIISFVIAVVSWILSAEKLARKTLAFVSIACASMFVINLLLLSKNFMAGPVVIFCALTLLYLFQKRRELKKQ